MLAYFVHSLFLFLLSSFLKHTKTVCNPNELDDANVQVIMNGKLLTDYGILSHANTYFYVRCKRDLINLYLLSARCKDNGEYEFMRSSIELREPVIQYCTDLYRTCLLSNIHQNLHTKDPSPSTSWPLNSSLNFFCSRDALQQEIIRAECLPVKGAHIAEDHTAVDWQYKFGGQTVSEKKIEHHCERYLHGCAKNEIHPAFELVGGVLDPFVFQANHDSVAVKCKGYAGDSELEALCEYQKWGYLDRGVAIEEPFEFFCENKLRTCLTKNLAHFLQESTDFLLEEVNHLGTLKVHCYSSPVAEKTIALSARCDQNNWVYSIGGAEKEVFDVELFCEGEVCLREDMPFASIVLADAENPVGAYIESGVSVAVRCRNLDGDEPEFLLECRDAKVVFTRAGVVIGEPIERYCAKLRPGKENAVEKKCSVKDIPRSHVYLLREQQNGEDAIESGASVNARCASVDVVAHGFRVHCVGSAIVYKKDNKTIEERIDRYCENLGLILRALQRRDTAARGRDACSLGDIPSARIELVEAAGVLKKGFVENGAVIAARCRGSSDPLRRFAIECRAAGLVYIRDGIVINGAMKDYCENLSRISMHAEAISFGDSESRVFGLEHRLVASVVVSMALLV